MTEPADPVRAEAGLRTRQDGPRIADLEGRIGDVLVEDEIARTPRAVIYRIRAGRRIDRPLALKVALRPLDAEDLVRFQHEVRLLSEVRHPNVVEVYDFGVLPGGFPFLTMQLLRAFELGPAGGTRDWEAFTELALGAAAGLSHIHRHGIVHLDLKPANLGFAEEGGGALKILDFGLAQDVRGPLDRRIRGTLAYTAPEVLMQDRYDHRADLYSLGVTLFQVATGVLPSAGSDEEAIRFHLQTETPDPLAYRPDMPPALASVVRRLLARDPQQRYPSAGKLLLELAGATGRKIDPGPMALGEARVLASRMVGRDAVMDRLRVRLAEAGRGDAGVVLVEGPEGIGKSRLLRELRLLATLQGARVGVGRAVAGRPDPLRPLREALESLGLAMPALVRGGSGREPGERFELYRRLADDLRAVAAEGGPLVLLLEDLQGAGEEVLQWLARAPADLGEARVLVVAARRVAAGSDAADWASDASLEAVRLDPLEPASLRDLVEASLGTGGLPETLHEWLRERSGGNPGALQQWLHHLIEQRVLRYRQGEWKPSLPALARLGAGASARHGVDRDRLSGLDPTALAVLQAIAVVGEPVHWREIATLLDRPAQEVYGPAAELLDRGLLERPPEGSQGLLALVGPGLAEAVGESLAPERRCDLHRRWAELLEAELANRPDRVGAVAEHFWQAGERARSLPHLMRAGEAAAGLFAFHDAAELYARAAEAALEESEASVAFAAQLRRAEALAAAGASARALEIYRALLQEGAGSGRRQTDRHRQAVLWLAVSRLHGRLGESAEQIAAADEGLRRLEEGHEVRIEVELLAARAEALARIGSLDEAWATARRALRPATRRHLTSSRARLLDVLGDLLTRRGELRKARFLLRRALAAAEEVDDVPLAARVRVHLAATEERFGEPDGAAALHRQNLEDARRVRDPRLELAAVEGLARLEIGRGAWREAAPSAERARDLARRLQGRESEARALVQLGLIAEQLGDWTRAERRYRRAERLLDGDGPWELWPTPLLRLGGLAVKRGQWAEAEELLRRAIAESEKTHRTEVIAAAHFELGSLDREREHWAPAAAHLGRTVELVGDGADRLSIRARIALADLALRDRDAESAAAALRAARGTAERRGDRFGEALVLAGEARLAAATHHAEAADRDFQEAIRRFETAGTPHEYARTLYEWGLRTADGDLALERLDRALVAFERLAATVDAERSRGAIRALRERQRVGGAAGGRTLPGLWEVAKVVNSTLDLQEVLDRTMDLVLERLRAERGMIVLLQPLTGELEIAVARNLGADEDGDALRLSETVVRQVIDRRQPVLSVDALTDPRFAGSESIVASHIVSILCVPLVIRERLAGAIYVDHSRSQHLFEPRDLEFLVAFADQAALAIDNARLYGELDSHRERLKEENESLRREILSSRHLGSLIGRSRAIDQLKDTLERVAPSHSTVLVRGESGTGKGLVARILHAISPRREGPFVHFNCAALPETLVESELFGHEKGSFTGAIGQKPGRFELAHKGTIFLDEIGKVSRSVQAKLLRVVEDREFERVGGTRTLKTDVRIVAATNLDLEQAIGRGEFREDLYYRLNIIPIVLPPLRERREDIPYLVEHFLAKISRDLGREAKEMDPAVLDLFLAYNWPGNVRELEAAIHRALVLSRGDRLAPEDFAWIRSGAGPAAGEGVGAAVAARRLAEGNYGDLVAGFDRELLAVALERCGGRIREAARFLGIARNTLKAKMKRYGLEGSDAG